MTSFTSQLAESLSPSLAGKLSCASVVLYFAISTLRSWLRLRHLPGPFLSQFSYWHMFKVRCRGSRAFSEYPKLTDRYGKLVRIGPNEVLTSDPVLIRRMSAAKSTYERSSWYKATRLDPYHDMMGSVLDKSAHHALRTKLSPGYLGKDIPGLEAGIDAGIADLIDLIRRKYISRPSESKAVDFGRLSHLYGMDARSRMSFGRPLGLLERDDDVFGLVRMSNLAIDVLQFFTDIPPLQKIFTSDLVLGLLGPKPTDSSGFGKIMG